MSMGHIACMVQARPNDRGSNPQSRSGPAYFRWGHLPTTPADLGATNKITFTGEYGNKSGWVTYTGPYLNKRLPHVELRSLYEFSRLVENTTYHKMKDGTIDIMQYNLNKIHRRGDTIAWQVNGLMRGHDVFPAHFTVHKGN